MDTNARLLGDEPADALVTALGAQTWAVNALLRGVRRNGDRLPEAIPQVVERFLTVDTAPPAWLDERRIARAQRWAETHSLHITTALFCASLPTAYAAARGARVLIATGRMGSADELDRRIHETARFVFDVIGRRGFAPEGFAIRGLQKVRLVHAAVRKHLIDRAVITDEVPINQEDMLGTLLTFSVTVVRAVRRLGVHVDPRDADDYFHLWRCAGFMLGIREELLPHDFAAAEEVGDAIAEREVRASEHGRALMKVLLARIEAHARFPGLSFAPRWLVRHTVGDAIADLLDVPRAETSQLALVVPPFARRGAVKLLATLAPSVGRTLLDATISAKLGGATPAFVMPDQRIESGGATSS